MACTVAFDLMPVGTKDEFNLFGCSVVEGQRNVSDSDGS